MSVASGTTAPTAARVTATSAASSGSGPSVLDYIRRTFDRRGAPGAQHALPPRAASPSVAGTPTPPAELPLLLPPALWTATVPGAPSAPQMLLDSVLQTRGPALFYYGLFSLDDETRAWLATRPALVAELSDGAAAPFVAASSGVRVRGTSIVGPGGPAARPAWESLVGHSMDDPAGFISALLRRDEGRLAVFYGAMAGLSSPQLHAALQLDAPEASRVDAAGRLKAAFERVLLRRRVDDQVFWRPPLDPALLITHLRTGPDGRPILPGDRRFWRGVFDDAERVFLPRDARRREARAAEPVDIAWLAEQVFSGQRVMDRRRYDLVLFVSRLSARDPRWATPAAIDAVRAAGAYPALMRSLERARLTDLDTYEAAARRADKITAIGDQDRARRALVQFQGALALVLRAGRGSTSPEGLAAAVSSLSAVEPNDHGEYEGRLVRWLDTWLAAHSAAGDLESAAVAALAGRVEPEPAIVEWEGTRYRVDLASAETIRLTRHLGERPRPWLSTARLLVAAADATGRGGLAADAAVQLAAALEQMAVAGRWNDSDSPDAVRAPAGYRDARSGLERAAKRADPEAAARLAPVLLRLADDLLGRGLTELAYASAFGDPERTTISAGEAAARHDFAPHFQGGPSAAWQLPAPAAVPNRAWHLTGSLLGLDVALAEFSLVRLSLKQPPRRPTLGSDQRRVLVEAVPLIEAASLGEPERAAMLSAIRAGRVRLSAARTAADAAALAAEINLSPLRRTLLAWTVTSARERMDHFLSMNELLWLGLRGAPVPPAWHSWGMPSTIRTGCLCLDLLDRQPWETLAGRVPSGTLASGFPDLNLRLAELLEELQMPAALLAPVLRAATLDFVETVAVRDADDREGLLDFVRNLRRERVEEYLALLTDDGPLVPVDPGGTR